ncbi:MAG: DUF11 domain-containing protein, partial [Verrucomicrobiales bacterium]|nr:DUF11 domain-containing protein [Verrucomicrobiales bacterium]
SPTPEDDEDDASVTGQQIDLEVTKSVSAPTVTEGENVTWTITLFNNDAHSNSTDATGVSVGDLIPNGTTFISANPPAGTSFDANTGVWTVGNLGEGDTTELTFVTRIDQTGTITNFAEVIAADQVDIDSSPDGTNDGLPTSPNPEDDEDDATVTGQQQGQDLIDLELVKTATVNGTNAPAISNVVFYFNDGQGGIIRVKFDEFSNLQDEHQHVNFDFTGTLYEGLTVVGFSVKAGSNNNPFGQGGEGTFFPVPDGMTPDNAATPQSFTQHSDLQASSFFGTVITAGDAATGVNVWSPDTMAAQVGDSITWSITLTNNDAHANSTTATGVEVGDIIPTGVGAPSNINVSQGSFDGNTGIWNVGTLNEGGTATLTFTTTVQQGGAITNFAEVSDADQPDLDSAPDPTPDSDPPIEDDEDNATIVVPQIDLEVTKDGQLNPSTTLLGQISELNKYLIIGTTSSATAQAVDVSNGDLGANIVVLSDEINDNVDADLDDVFLNNAGSEWVNVNNTYSDSSDFLPGAAGLVEGVSWRGDIALTSPNASFNMSNTEVYAQAGVVSASSNPADSVSNSEYFSNGNGDGFDTTNTGQNMPTMGVGENDPAMSALRSQLDSFEAYITGLAPEATLSPGGTGAENLPSSGGIQDQDIFELDVAQFDTNGDGIAVIDIDMGSNDFNITNSNWIIEDTSANGVFAIFRILGDSNMVLSQSTIMAGDGIDNNGGVNTAGPGAAPNDLRAIFVKASSFSDGQGGTNPGEAFDSGDVVFNLQNTVLNGIGLYDLSVFNGGNANFDNGTTQMSIQNGQGVAHFISPKVTFSNVRFDQIGLPDQSNQTATWTVTVSNNDQQHPNIVTATGVVVTDAIPPGATPANVNASKGTFDSNTGVWTVGTLAPGETATLTFDTEIGASQSLINSAQVTAANEFDPDSQPGEDAIVPNQDDEAADTVNGPNVPPVVLDLDGDGLEFVSKSEGPGFDFDSDGVPEQTAWVGEDDAFLVHDENGDGLVTEASEIAFANLHPDAVTDLEGLRLVFDSNNDGVLDANDVSFANFGLWQDLNGDGVTDTGEYRTLTEEGIISIDLFSDGNQYSTEDGDVFVFGESSFTRADGSEGIVGDVALKAQTLPALNELVDNSGTADDLLAEPGEENQKAVQPKSESQGSAATDDPGTALVPETIAAVEDAPAAVAV